MSEIILKIEKQTIKAQIGNTELPDSYDNIQCILKDIAHYYPNLIQISRTNRNTHISINILLRIIGEETNIPIIFGILGDALKTTFKQGIVLQCRYFMQDVSFQECEFEDNFSAMGCNFYKDILFDKAEFQRFFIASKSIFHKQISFWNAKFSEIPNFSGVGFIECNLVNFINAKIKKDSFGDLVQLAENETGHLEQNKAQSIIKDLRDSYRAVKNTLIQQNNLLDASQWHKLELYCKEIELDSKKPNIFSRDWIDKWVLRFYRHTSDHHTDLLKILNNIMMLIALFGIFSLVLVLIATNENPPETLGIVSHIWDFSQVSNIQNQQKIFYVVGQIPTSLEWNDYCGCKIWGEVSFIFGVCIFFILAFLGLLCLQKCVYIYRCVISLSYLIVLVILAIKPALLLPIFGKLLDESLKVNFPAFTSLSIVYAILMFLLLFSLQKTARKNSIVPS